MKHPIKKTIAALIAAAVTVTGSVTAFAATDIYTVRRGDSLWTIAEKYKVGLSEIIAANP
ncbi:MAG: LysM peptidoglycan-binding domain-containing protein, partial [Clostridiales bacterium]|nr:LysM peptidoglycan-binding domain-containing protein [Clostridiales bacterium]